MAATAELHPVRAVLIEGGEARLLSSMMEINRATKAAQHGGRKARLPGAAFNSSPTDLLAAERPDFVLMSAPGADFGAFCMAAIAGGSHVLVIPPATIEPELGSKLLRRAVSAGLQIGVAVGPEGGRIGQARALVAAGRIGRPLLFNISAFGPGPMASHFGPPGADCGDILLRALHRILAILGTEPAAAGSATAGTSGGSLSCVLQLANGVAGAVQVARNCPNGTGERLEIYGTEGMMMLTRSANAKGTSPLHLVTARVDVGELLANPTDPDKLKRRFRPVEPNGRWPTVAADFVHAMQSGRPFTPSLAQALRMRRAADAILAASRADGWASIDYQGLPEGLQAHG